jgi:hypothetical protein
LAHDEISDTVTDRIDDAGCLAARNPGRGQGVIGPGADVDVVKVHACRGLAHPQFTWARVVDEDLF